MSEKESLPVILAVDDATIFVRTLKTMLRNSPYELHCASSAEEALEYLQGNDPSIILLDIVMPDMDGYELAREIKSMGKTAPIIFITANSTMDDMNKAAEVGAVGFLMKPLRLSELHAKLEEFS